MRRRRRLSFVGHVLHWLRVAFGSLGLTLLFFLLLPVIQAISEPPTAGVELRSVDTAVLPPPPPPPPVEEEPEEEEEPEPPKPELQEQELQLDLTQLEGLIDPGFGDGWMTNDFSVDLGGEGGDDDVAALFSLADLDQKPRAIYQPSPILTAKHKKKAPGTVQIVFVVDERGRVKNPVVQSSTDPVFERAALAAVKQWRFEPGKRNGEPVQFRMRVPITFPKS